MTDEQQRAHDLHMLRTAVQHAALWSRDPSTKVACIVEWNDKAARPGGFDRITQMGFHNVFESPEGFDPATATREERYAAVIHAEEDALMCLGYEAAMVATFYVTHEPCGSCWRKLARYAARVVYLGVDDERRERWGCEAGYQHARTRLNENGDTIEIVRYEASDL